MRVRSACPSHTHPTTVTPIRTTVGCSTRDRGQHCATRWITRAAPQSRAPPAARRPPPRNWVGWSAPLDASCCPTDTTTNLSRRWAPTHRSFRPFPPRRDCWRRRWPNQHRTPWSCCHCTVVTGWMAPNMSAATMREEILCYHRLPGWQSSRRTIRPSATGDSMPPGSTRIWLDWMSSWDRFCFLLKRKM